MKKLVIVESPTKANTISRFLDASYRVESSYGHIRDLPQKEIGVNVRKDFEPKYVIPPKARKQVKKLKDLAQKTKEVYLATDEDREGEAISWHLTQALKLDEEKAKRITFHEITKSAIVRALKKPRKINMDLVDAQQARRILDRLVGYRLSPFLWRKVARGLSAGRVQSAALRLIADREKEIKKFKPVEYWTIEAELQKRRKTKSKPEDTFRAQLFKHKNKPIPRLGIKNKKASQDIVKSLENARYTVQRVERKEVKKSPLPPFTTSTLQQSAAGVLGYSTKQTMRLAQQLYEGIKIGKGQAEGLITYMRTDSTHLAQKALKEMRKEISKQFGAKYLPPKPQVYRTKSKLAQEAHEAIRPTKAGLNPQKVKTHLDPQQFKLYNLIWKRTIACQMQKAVIDSTKTEIKARDYYLRAEGTIIKFDGFMKVYPLPTQEKILPPLKKKEIVDCRKLIPEQHFTEPPNRYTEATLVRALEKHGIGRPSTYAPTISTLQDRGYVEKIEKKLHPKEIGVVVNDMLVKHFPEIVDLKFTAKIENDLDDIARDKKEWVPIIREFYDPFIQHLRKKEKQVKKKQTKTRKKCPKCRKILIIKYGRFGKFLGCSGYPDCKHTEPLGKEKALAETLSKEKCQKCGKPMTVRHGRFGAFLGCSGYPKCKNIKAIEKKVGVQCPRCSQGEIVEKHSKKGRLFFACNQYPKCKFALWSKPTGKKCPNCGSLIVYGKENSKVCSNKECNQTAKK